MPYLKQKKGDEFCVYKKGADGEPEGDALGCHASEQECNDQLAALYASENKKAVLNGLSDKTLSFEDVLNEIRSDFWAQFKPEESSQPVYQEDAGWIEEVYDEYVIVSKNGEHYRVRYTSNPEQQHVFAPEELWVPVSLNKEWREIKTVDLKTAQIAAANGDNSLKAIAADEDTIRVGNYMILFGGTDLEGFLPGTTRVIKANPDGTRGERFAKDVDISSDYLDSGFLHMDFEHGRDPDRLGNNSDVVLGFVDVKSIRRDNKGVWREAVLSRRHHYMKWLETLIEEGLMGTSTEPVQSMIAKAADGTITKWGLKRDTITATPAEPRMMKENVLAAFKALNIELPEPKDDPAGSVKAKGSNGDSDKPANTTTTRITKPKGAIKMFDKIEDVLALELPNEEKAALITKLGLGAPAQSKDDKPAAAEAALTREDVKTLFSESMEELGFGKKAGAPAGKRLPYDPEPKDPPAAAEDTLQKHIYTAKFGEDSAAKSAVMTDLLGSNYQDFLLVQDKAFSRYLRYGRDGLDTPELFKALKTQVFPIEHIFAFVKGGGSVSEVKTTMVESQGQLGGFAVPPSRQTNIITRVAGLTAVRSAGAMVVTLLNGNATEFPRYSGGDDRYRGALRGAWGGENATAGERNATLDMVTVSAGIYLYKIPMSQSLVDDAINLVELVESDIVATLAIDEDEAFLVGLGIGGEPHGILPGGLNSHGLEEINSEDASTLTPGGLKKLKRGLATQYRRNGVWVAASDTYSTIETMVDGNGQYMFDDLSETDQLLKRKVYESEAMPAVAANAFPLIFGDMSGYGIVERLGLTIERFQDSGTGLGKVEYHVRRRIGGNILQPWKFAVQKVAA